MTLLASMAPLTNGAQLIAFPGAPTPLNIVAVLVSYPQSRKSQLTGLAKQVGDALDCAARAAAVRAYLEQDVELPDGALPLSALKVQSSVLSTFTPEAFFERLSSDFGQIKNADKLNAPCPTSSVHYGRLANVDEVYGAFAALGLRCTTTRARVPPRLQAV